MTLFPFDLVHSDVWGPAPIPSKGGNRFIDDFSRFTWLSFMHSRSELLTIYKNFTTMVHTQFGKTMKVFRSDGAGIDIATLSCLSYKGLHSRALIPLNKMVLLSASIAIFLRLLALFFSLLLSLPLYSCSSVRAEAVLTAVYLINRTP